ncbi:MAG: hypothetical protein LBI02_01645 [Opitutaceae bacterium]|nr:hypothetical protein [Opitutaceae bacterium]
MSDGASDTIRSGRRAITTRRPNPSTISIGNTPSSPTATAPAPAAPAANAPVITAPSANAPAIAATSANAPAPAAASTPKHFPVILPHVGRDLASRRDWFSLPTKPLFTVAE